MKMSIYKRFFAVVMLVASFTFVAPVAQAQTVSSVQQATLSSDQVKLQLIQLLLQLIEKYQAQLAEMQKNTNQEAVETEDIEADEEVEDEEEPEEREVITLTSQGVGEWAERSEDLDKTVTLAVFDIYAEKEDLDGTTFRVTEKGLPYGKPALKYTCSDVIEKGETKSCRVKVTGVEGYSGIKYKITDVTIEAVDGTEYKSKFPAVEGYIADQ